MWLGRALPVSALSTPSTYVFCHILAIICTHRKRTQTMRCHKAEFILYIGIKSSALRARSGMCVCCDGAHAVTSLYSAWRSALGTHISASVLVRSYRFNQCPWRWRSFFHMPSGAMWGRRERVRGWNYYLYDALQALLRRKKCWMND